MPTGRKRERRGNDDAILWYVIADANAISVDGSGNAIDLVAGTTLKLPAVRNEQNSSQTFDPYDPLQRIGSTTPALAYLPPPPSGHCNTLADLIVVAASHRAGVAELAPGRVHGHRHGVGKIQAAAA
ncbi:hypothetical protein B1A_15459, partial [mine drainage metagenome]